MPPAAAAARGVACCVDEMPSSAGGPYTKNPIIANGISFATSGADVGTDQNAATASAMPRKQNTQVR